MMEKYNFGIFRMAKVRFRLTNVHYVWILSIFVSFFYGLIDKAGFLISISFKMVENLNNIEIGMN